jgi:hypothetical protein
MSFPFPNLLVLYHQEEELTVVIAIHKGREAFVHPRPGGAFQMCSVTTLKKQEGDGQVGDNGARKVLRDLGELRMFEDWVIEGK